jgi:hypothetical protein
MLGSTFLYTWVKEAFHLWALPCSDIIQQIFINNEGLS